MHMLLVGNENCEKYENIFCEGLWGPIDLIIAAICGWLKLSPNVH